MGAGRMQRVCVAPGDEFGRWVDAKALRPDGPTKTWVMVWLCWNTQRR